MADTTTPTAPTEPPKPPIVTAATVDKVVDALLAVLQKAAGPETIETQQILLRRLALSGDVIPSRIRPPKNITEIGGYLNLLFSDKFKRESHDPGSILGQTVASILGVAGPTVDIGPLPSVPKLTFTSRTNDRPKVDGLDSLIPNTYLIRSDFAPDFDHAMQQIHASGALVFWIGAPQYLPAQSVPFDLDHVLPYLGREISLVAATALRDLNLDPIIIGRIPVGPANPRQPFLVAARVTETPAAGATVQPPANWECFEPVPAGGFRLHRLTTAAAFCALNEFAGDLNQAGWYQPQFVIDFATPSVDRHWNRWTNVSGLYGGATTLGAELAMLYTPREIYASNFVNELTRVWDDRTGRFEKTL